MATRSTESIGDDELSKLELEFYLNAETHSYDRSVLFIGITGHGKSSLCNFLLNEKTLNIDNTMISCSDSSKQAITYIKGVKYLFVDVPGVCDTSRDPKIVLSELVKAFFFVRKQGISSIAIVIDPHPKMTAELYDALEDFLNRISSEIWKHVFVVFTHEKRTIKNYKSGNEYISSILQNEGCPKFLKFISEHCNNRFLHVECKRLSENEHYWETKVSEFTQFVENIQTNNGYFRLEIMNVLEKNYQKIIVPLTQKEELVKRLQILHQKQVLTKQEIKECLKLCNQIEKIDKEVVTAIRIMKIAFILSLGFECTKDILLSLGLGVVTGSLLVELGIGAGVGCAVLAPVVSIPMIPIAVLVLGLGIHYLKYKK